MEGRPTMEHSHVHSHCSFKCVSWSSVVAGGLIGVGLSFLLNLFSAAIGLAAFSSNTDTGATAFAVGGFIGFLIGALVAMFVTGFVAGYLAKPYCSRRNLGAMYGFFAWSLTLILSIILSTHVAKFVAYNADILNNRPVVVADDVAPGAVNTSGNTTNVNSRAAASDLSKVAFTSFALFFLGAAAACFGGYAGMSCRREECLDEPRV